MDGDVMITIVFVLEVVVLSLAAAALVGRGARKARKATSVDHAERPFDPPAAHASGFVEDRPPRRLDV